MIDSVLLWALPNAWTQFELLAPDVEERFEAEMRRRFEGPQVEEVELALVIGMQVESLREFAADGVILLATRAEEARGPDDPPPGLSLTLALANRPASVSPGKGERREGSAKHAGPSLEAAGAAASASEATALVLDDPELIAFTKEGRTEVSVPGISQSLARFQAQAFVVPKDQLGMAVITVTTFKPELADEARQAARNFADTLCFVKADSE